MNVLSIVSTLHYQFGWLAPVQSPWLDGEKHYMYGLLTKCEVKMAGYWPSSFFCVFMDRDGVEVHKHAKKERGQYPAILTSHLVNKGFIIGLLGKFFLRDKAGSPERARWLHLARSGSQSQRRI